VSYWKMERTKENAPIAALYGGKKLIAKVYLSPDSEVLRIVLPEFMSAEKQVKLDSQNHLIDFRRKITEEF
jgi:hypothetical protein